MYSFFSQLSKIIISMLEKYHFFSMMSPHIINGIANIIYECDIELTQSQAKELHRCQKLSLLFEMMTFYQRNKIPYQIIPGNLWQIADYISQNYQYNTDNDRENTIKFCKMLQNKSPDKRISIDEFCKKTIYVQPKE